MSEQNDELIEPTNETISSMIYEIRGQKVMLDFDLAKIYGYETSRLNQQVKRNIDKFPDDFMFQITKEELDSIMMSQIVISRWGGLRKLPYAFTEQGIYMLMTVLKGELAVKQSVALVRLFKQMKDYISENNRLTDANGIIDLTRKVERHEADLMDVKKKLSVVMDKFIDPNSYKHFLILDGKQLEADIAYQKIYSLAKKSITIVDDYISIKTLELLRASNTDVVIYIYSDNKAKSKLPDSFIEDFVKERKQTIVAKPTKDRFHDRYIVIDYATENEMIFHCGASSKDAGNKITTIMKVDDIHEYKKLFDDEASK